MCFEMLYIRCSKILIIGGVACKKEPNTADPDQTASSETFCPEPFLFAVLTSIFWIPALISNILSENRNLKEESVRNFRTLKCSQISKIHLHIKAYVDMDQEVRCFYSGQQLVNVLPDTVTKIVEQ